MKRASYSIPIFSLGVTLVGCQDPIVGDFNATFFEGTGLPLTYSEVDPETGVTCTINAYATMSVGEDLRVSMEINYNYQCDDGSPPESYKYSDTGKIELLEKGLAYKIIIDGTDSATLECSMDLAGILFCNDENDAAFVFEPAN